MQPAPCLRQPRTVPIQGPTTLDDVLANHKRWVEPRTRRQGTQANLENQDLSRVDLKNADLRGAVLTRANLSGADISGAKFSTAPSSIPKRTFIGLEINSENYHPVDTRLENVDLSTAIGVDVDFTSADLTGANFKGARLFNVNFRDANLANADFGASHGARAIPRTEFAEIMLTGANLANTDLPTNTRSFHNIAQSLNTQIKNCKHILQAHLMFLLYGCVTLVALPTPAATLILPIMGVEIGIATFYVLFPLISLFLFLYFHLNLTNLWCGLSELPAVFPDGSSVTDRLHSWAIVRLVERRWPRLRRQMARPFARTTRDVAYLMAYWSTPLVFLLFWAKYLPQQDWFGTSLHLLIVTTGIASGLVMQWVMHRILRGGNLGRSLLNALFVEYAGRRKVLWITAWLGILMTLLVGVSWWLISSGDS